MIINLTDALQVEREKNAQLRAALELTQDAARMAAFVVDPRVQMSPAMAVKHFNTMFPEIKKALADSGGMEEK